ncbi:carbohydrate ABC transporter permease [bacterium]|nr:carbohydrate ABC transporter permease [bacterium]
MHRFRNMLLDLLVHIILITVGIFMVVPFVWMVVTSLKDPTEVLAFPPRWIPEQKYYAVLPGENAREVRVQTISAPDTGSAENPSTISSDQLVVRCIEPGPDQGRKWSIGRTDLRSRRFLWSNYPRAWSEISREVTFSRYFYVTTIVALLTTLGQLITSTLAAFAFARLKFFLNHIIFTILLGTMMVPQPVLLIPDFILLAKFGWLNTFYALIVPWLANVFGIFLLRQYFLTIPEELLDAARIDGCGNIRILVQIMVPLAKPILMTLALFTFIGSWNSFMWPLIVTNSPDMRTLQVGLASLQSESGIQWTLMMAASTFSLIPLIVLFFFVQKHLIESFARSGLKG